MENEKKIKIKNKVRVSRVFLYRSRSNFFKNIYLFHRNDFFSGGETIFYLIKSHN